MKLVTSTIVIRERGGMHYTKFKYWFLPEGTPVTSVENKKITDKKETSIWGKSKDEVKIRVKTFLNGLKPPLVGT